MDPFVNMLLGIVIFVFLVWSMEFFAKRSLIKNPKLSMWEFFEKDSLVPANIIFFNAIFWARGVDPLVNALPDLASFVCGLGATILASPVGTLPIFLRLSRMFGHYNNLLESETLEA